MAAKIITVAQQKGGAGKTTLAAHLAVAYTAMKKRVVAVDIDPQQSLSRWYELRQERMDGTAAGVLVSAIEGWRARVEIDRVAAGHDVVIIDSPPHAETEARIAIRAADLVVVPVQPSPMDVWATRPTLELAAAENVPALLVFNRVLARAKLTEAMEAEAKQLVPRSPAPASAIGSPSRLLSPRARRWANPSRAVTPPGKSRPWRRKSSEPRDSAVAPKPVDAHVSGRATQSAQVISRTG